MSDWYYGDIKMFGGNFAPVGWALCNGQLLPIAGNETLFNLIGTTYGGDGQSTFALPDLRGRLPIGQGQGPGLQNHDIGEVAGTESVTVTTNTLPSHTHTLGKGSLAVAGNSAKANRRNPSQAVYAVEAAGVTGVYSDAIPNTTMAPAALTGAPVMAATGSAQPTSVRQPTLTVTFIIAISGLFPSRN